MVESVATGAVFATAAFGMITGWVTYPRVALLVRRRRWSVYFPMDEPKPKRGDPYKPRYTRTEGLRQVNALGQRSRFSMLVSVVTMGAGIGLIKMIEWFP
mgnify:FL=1